MSNLLKEKLISYQQVTIKLIDMIKQENYDFIGNLLDDRQVISSELEKINYFQQDFITFSSELNLLDLENILNELINDKKQSVRAKIDKVNAVKSANNNYQKSFRPDSLFFNKKI